MTNPTVSFASGLTFLSAGDCPTTRWSVKLLLVFANTIFSRFILLEIHDSSTVLLITYQHGSHRKHRSSVGVSIVLYAAIGAERLENTVPLLLLTALV